MPKVNRNNTKKPLMEKLETGGLGGKWQPSSRPAYDKNAQLYREINDGLGKAMKFGLSFFEGMMKEVFDVDITKYNRAKRVTKKRGMRF